MSLRHTTENIADGKPPATSAPAAEIPLARRFVAMLLDEDRKPSLVEQLQSSVYGNVGSDLDDEDDGFDPGTSDEIATLSVEVAAAAVLMAARFESDPALLREIRKNSPVVIVQAPDEGMAAPLETVIRVCVLGRAVQIVPTRILDGTGSGMETFERRTAVVVHFADEKRRKAEMHARAMRALSLDVPLIALSTDPSRSVPEVLRVLSDATMVLAGWTSSSLEVVTQAVTGEIVVVAPEPWIASVTLDDLRSALSRSRGGTRSVERLRRTVMRRQKQAASSPRLEDLAGYGEARRVGLEIVADLRAYGEGRLAWSEVPPGLVLAGPPGSGKTLFAGALARSAGLPLIVGSLAVWQAAGHLGELLAAMRKSFAEAKAAAPAILFIDEIDSFGDRATFDSRNRDYCAQVVNGLLEQLDGADGRAGVLVVAASNFVERVDPAILRSGRLDRVIRISLPEPRDLVEILRTQLGDDLKDEDLLPVTMAARGSTGADTASWVRRARGKARRAGRDLELSDLLEAADTGIGRLSGKEMMRVSLHEAGHAVCVAALGLGTVSEISLHSSGGHTRIDRDVRSTTRTEAIASIVNFLGGREAERAILGTISAGAGGSEDSDLAQATRIAFAYEYAWGLGQAGPVWTGGYDYPPPSLLHSPAMEPVIGLLRHAEGEAARLVAENRTAIERCAEHLRADGYLDAAAVKSAIGRIGIFDLRLPPRQSGRRLTGAEPEQTETAPVSGRQV